MALLSHDANTDARDIGPPVDFAICVTVSVMPLPIPTRAT
jgi:hypothetical protein